MTQLLDYIVTQEEAIITYSASDMVSSRYTTTPATSASSMHEVKQEDASSCQPTQFIYPATVPFSTSQIIKNIMSLAAKAELGALYIMARKTIHIRNILAKLGHKQPRTQIQTDNATAEAIINSTVQPKQTEAMDMRFHWLRNQSLQKQLRIYWRSGKLNYANYFTKYHPPTHHINTRKEFITPQHVLQALLCTKFKAAEQDIGATKAAEYAMKSIELRQKQLCKQGKQLDSLTGQWYTLLLPQKYVETIESKPQ